MRQRLTCYHKLFRLCIVLATSLCFASIAHAVIIFEATLNGAQETPPTASTATGFGTFVLNDPQTQLTFNIAYEGLLGGDVSAAHFHNAPPGVAGPVVRNVSGLFTSPNGVIVGVWTDLDAMPLTAALVAELLQGDIYFNIHTNDPVPPNFPGGEIRGQLVRAAVPEPGSLALLGISLAAFGIARRRKNP